VWGKISTSESGVVEMEKVEMQKAILADFHDFCILRKVQIIVWRVGFEVRYRSTLLRSSGERALRLANLFNSRWRRCGLAVNSQKRKF
jgi:hypothetical protein